MRTDGLVPWLQIGPVLGVVVGVDNGEHRVVHVSVLCPTGDVKKVRAQALKFRKLFEIAASDIVPQSYSDLTMAKRKRRSGLG